jgi:Ankyrin repeats (3 copies)
VLFRLCCSLLTLLAVLPAFDSLALAQAVAQPRTAELFSGVIGNTALDLVLLMRGNEVLGASYRPAADRNVEWDQPLAPARLLTGTRTGSRVRLREWDARDSERAVVEATWSAGALRGTWRERGAQTAISFALRRHPSPYAAFSRDRPALVNGHARLTWPVIVRLHGAVRGSQWDDARFESQLLCALTLADTSPDGCGWIEAMAALAEGREPTRIPRATWIGLALEQQGRYADAFDHYQENCGLTFSSCAFLLDLLDRVDPAMQRVGLARACRSVRMGCDVYWGRNEVALVDAARRGDLAGVEQLLTMPVDVNAGGDGAMLTALQAAVLAKSLPVVKALLEAGGNPNTPTSLLSATGVGLPLDYAVRHNLDAIALWLLEHGARANVGQVLAEAAMLRKRAIVARILENGEHPDERPFPAGSALAMAVQNADIEMVKMLLARGADPDFTTNFSVGSPIDRAREKGQKAILAVLLAARNALR